MQVISKGQNFENKEVFLVVLENGITIECVETFRNTNRFARVLQARLGNNKLSAIKEIRDNLGLGLKESKDLVEALWR
jgi:ribosomal protein L7/L12